MSEPKASSPSKAAMGFKIRERDGCLTSAIEDGIDRDAFPFALELPCPPWAFGETGGVVTRKGKEALDALLNQLAAMQPEREGRARACKILEHLVMYTDKNGTVNELCRDALRALKGV